MNTADQTSGGVLLTPIVPGSFAALNNDLRQLMQQLSSFKMELSAIHSAHSTAQFSPDGFVLDANDRFLHLLGYSRGEVIGKHHSIFVPTDDTKSIGYANFWSELRSGGPQIRNFKRVTKNGKEIWLNASYIPILGSDGQVSKVVKYATDVTNELQDSQAIRAKMRALDKAQAVIEFRLDSSVVHANQVFLDLLGYELSEVTNAQHRMFVTHEEAESVRYRIFWDALRRGEPQTGRFHRIGRNGREVWIQASYNPILDLDGRVTGIVKFATDITRHMNLRTQIFGELAT